MRLQLCVGSLLLAGVCGCGELTTGSTGSATGAGGATATAGTTVVAPSPPVRAPVGRTVSGELVVTPVFFGLNYTVRDGQTAWSPDGSQIAWADAYGNVWSASAVPTGHPARLFGPSGTPLLMTPSGVASLPYYFEVESIALVPALSGAAGVAGTTAAVSPRGSLIAYQTTDGQVAWQPLDAGGQITLAGPGRSPSWNADGTLLGYIDEQNQLNVLDIQTGDRELFPFPAGAGYPILAPNGRAVLFPVIEQAGAGISIATFQFGSNNGSGASGILP